MGDSSGGSPWGVPLMEHPSVVLAMCCFFIASNGAEACLLFFSSPVFVWGRVIMQSLCRPLACLRRFSVSALTDFCGYLPACISASGMLLPSVSCRSFSACLREVVRSLPFCNLVMARLCLRQPLVFLQRFGADLPSPVSSLLRRCHART